jgi:hypothetical protein
LCHYAISTPLIWKLTDVADAPPLIVFGVAFAGITCFKSKNAVELAAIVAVVNMSVPSMVSVNVPAVPAVLVTAMLVTTVVVEVVGTVYNVVVVVVVAAPLKRVFADTAIRVGLPS